MEHGGLVFVNFYTCGHEFWPVDLRCFAEDLGVYVCAGDDDLDIYAACSRTDDGISELVIWGEVGVLDED